MEWNFGLTGTYREIASAILGLRELESGVRGISVGLRRRLGKDLLLYPAKVAQ